MPGVQRLNVKEGMYQEGIPYLKNKLKGLKKNRNYQNIHPHREIYRLVLIHQVNQIIMTAMFLNQIMIIMIKISRIMIKILIKRI